MTRKEQIKEKMFGISTSNATSAIDYGAYRAGFIDGVDWADAHPQDRWISVEDELPKEDGRYLFYHTTIGVLSTYYYNDLTLDKAVTHWMQLPQQPSSSEIPNNHKEGGEQ